MIVVVAIIALVSIAVIHSGSSSKQAGVFNSSASIVSKSANTTSVLTTTLTTQTSSSTIIASTTSVTYNPTSTASVPTTSSTTSSSTTTVLTNPIAANSCGNATKILEVCPTPFHEDSAIEVTLNLTSIKPTAYSQLGFIVVLGAHYVTGVGSQYVDGNFVTQDVVSPLGNGTYSREVPNLEPDSNYTVCLTGFNNHTYTSTGYFDCVSANTASAKPATALILENYDLNQSTLGLIGSWLGEVQSSNPTLVINTMTLPSGTTSGELLQMLKTDYNSSNLKYVVLIGYNLPIPQISASWGIVSSVMPYQSLGKSNSQFLYGSSLNDVAIAVIRPGQESQMNPYFERLISYYQGSQTYSPQVLVADAMTPAQDNSTATDFVNSRYASSNIDFLDGIANYSNTTQALQWQNTYSNYLKNNQYQFLILIAHGATTFHYPCGASGCINASFIQNANPDVLFTIAVSCNIGNFETVGSPLVAYVFDGNSLAGLGSDVEVLNVNSQLERTMYNDMVENNTSIGEAGSPYGFIVIGDPFLKVEN